VEFSDIEVGQIVRIIDWPNMDGYRPDHWSPEMDEWCGAEVEICDADPDTEEIFICEDEGNWQWYASDFDPVCRLALDDPNIRFKAEKHNRRIDEIRSSLKVKKS
jgi:hypothetical protein